MPQVDEKAELVICCFCGSIKVRVSLPSEKPRYKCINCGAITYYTEPRTDFSGQYDSMLKVSLGSETDG